MEALADLSADWLKTGIDIILIIAVGSLWVTWLRNGQRQKRLEKLLLECADQLEEATRHLNEATTTIEKVKLDSATAESPASRPEKAPFARTTKAARKPVTEAKAEPAAQQSMPDQNSTQATMVLRMHREGDEPQTIAEKLDMPLAQVKLLLKIYATTQS